MTCNGRVCNVIVLMLCIYIQSKMKLLKKMLDKGELPPNSKVSNSIIQCLIPSYIHTLELFYDG